MYGNQGNLQPFGYTSYQRDEIAGTYYAQAREYQAESGRFAGQDIVAEDSIVAGLTAGIFYGIGKVKNYIKIKIKVEKPKVLSKKLYNERN